MITPQFEVTQDDQLLYIHIRAPYIKASLIQFEVNDDVFVFSLPPYYLRLRLPAKVIEDERISSTYDISTSTVHCQVAKLNEGEHFQDLDMLSKLLAKKKQHKPVIDEIRRPEDIEGSDNEEDDVDWEIEQSQPHIFDGTEKYGFDSRYKDAIGLSLCNGNEVNEVLDPEHDHCSREFVNEQTLQRFDPDHYVADFMDDSQIQEIIRWKLPDETELSPAEKDRIVRLGQRKHIVSRPKQVYIALLQLLFGACYDQRTNMGDITVESAWTVGKLAPCMCFLFNDYTRVEDVVKDCTLRALCVPLYRHWKLVETVWLDVLTVLEHGRRGALKILVRLLEAFESDLHFVYRQIWIDDLTVWVQSASDAVIAGLCTELRKTLGTLDKNNLDIPLTDLEETALEPDSDDED